MQSELNKAFVTALFFRNLQFQKHIYHLAVTSSWHLDLYVAGMNSAHLLILYSVVTQIWLSMEY